MGAAMAARLLTKNSVLAFNRSTAALDRLVESGASAAMDAKEALACEISISMLANDAACDEILSVGNISPSTTHVCMASISPELAKELSSRFEKAGARYISAPVLGRPPVAASGDLHILAGGDFDSVQTLTPLLSSMAKRVWFIGPEAHQANLVKIAVNYNILHAIQALAESIALVETNGIHAGEFISILSESLFGGVVYKNYGQQLVARNYEPVMFAMELGRKDLSLVETTAKESGIALPSTGLLSELMDLALANPDLANKDWAAVAEITRTINLTKTNKAPE